MNCIGTPNEDSDVWALAFWALWANDHAFNVQSLNRTKGKWKLPLKNDSQESSMSRFATGQNLKNELLFALCFDLISLARSSEKALDAGFGREECWRARELSGKGIWRVALCHFENCLPWRVVVAILALFLSASRAGLQTCEPCTADMNARRSRNARNAGWWEKTFSLANK